MVLFSFCPFLAASMYFFCVVAVLVFRGNIEEFLLKIITSPLQPTQMCILCALFFSFSHLARLPIVEDTTRKQTYRNSFFNFSTVSFIFRHLPLAVEPDTVQDRRKTDKGELYTRIGMKKVKNCVFLFSCKRNSIEKFVRRKIAAIITQDARRTIGSFFHPKKKGEENNATR